MKIFIIVGTRPNIVKITRFKQAALEFRDLNIEIVHTGQHYDRMMMDVFFVQFGLKPDFQLTLRGNDVASQMGYMMADLAALLATHKPDLVIVPGDVNSTLVAGLTAHRSNIPVAHLEAGLRSNDRQMTEEINRILVDQIADLHFVTEQSGLENLKREGVSDEKVHFVGNTMIDALVGFRRQIEASQILEELNIKPGEFFLATMHRPSNVDYSDGLLFLYDLLKQLCTYKPVVFPVHPRTRKRFEDFGLLAELNAINDLLFIEPQEYFAFQKLVATADVVITDSGGIQEETTFYGIPCVTLRDNTERPITCTSGTNRLVPRDMDEIQKAISFPKTGTIPPLWDGYATERVLNVIRSYFT